MITSFLSFILFAMFILIAVFFVQFLISRQRYHISPTQMVAMERIEDVPTVSLCIPARNETHALEDCLTAAIMSNYPKLEIIVLDDCSQDKTSEMIRSFAHEGVRFVQGEVPSDGWLGKNKACEALAREAHGEYLVFMGVDTRLEPESLSRLIGYMQTTKLSMASVLPQRRDYWRASVVFAPLRYFWQFIMPLKFNTPTSTALWAIRSKALKDVGGFDSVKEQVAPENIFASLLFQRQEYRFLVSDSSLPVWYAKKWQSQWDTGVRLWYPLLGKNIAAIIGTCLVHVGLFILPLIAVIYPLLLPLESHPVLEVSFFLGFINLFLAVLLYFLYFCQTHAQKWSFFNILPALLLPILAVQEIFLLLASYLAYKRGQVDWKGRNVCYPARPRYLRT